MRYFIVVVCLFALIASAGNVAAQQPGTQASPDDDQGIHQASEADAEPELSDEQLAGFMMQIDVLSQRFERTTPEMRTVLGVISGIMLMGSTEEDVQGYLGETLDLLERTNLPNPIDAPLVPTGNGLLDAYLAEAERQVYTMKLDAEDWQAQIETVGVPTPEFLAPLAPEYGTEPDYWELKYVAALAAGESEEQALSVFAEAEQAGYADSELLCNWYKALQAVHLGVAYKSASLPDDSGYAHLTDEMFDGEQALLDRAIALNPDNALPYYQRALINLARGKDADGLRDLQAGRAAPEYTPPLVFPLREIYASYYEDAPAGSATADGAILAHYLLGLPYNFGQSVNLLLLKHTIKLSLNNHAAPDDELVLALWDYLMRTGQLPHLERLDRLTISTRSRQILAAVGGGDEFHSLHPDLDILNLGLIGTFQDASRLDSDYISAVITMSVAGGLPGYFAGIYASFEATADPNPESVAQVFADLAEFDIHTMTPPPSWEKYRAAGAQRLAEIEERQQREQEQAEESGT